MPNTNLTGPKAPRLLAFIGLTVSVILLILNHHGAVTTGKYSLSSVLFLPFIAGLCGAELTRPGALWAIGPRNRELARATQVIGIIGAFSGLGVTLLILIYYQGVI